MLRGPQHWSTLTGPSAGSFDIISSNNLNASPTKLCTARSRLLTRTLHISMSTVSLSRMFFPFAFSRSIVPSCFSTCPRTPLRSWSRSAIMISPEVAIIWRPSSSVSDCDRPHCTAKTIPRSTNARNRAIRAGSWTFLPIMHSCCTRNTTSRRRVSSSADREVVEDDDPSPCPFVCGAPFAFASVWSTSILSASLPSAPESFPGSECFVGKPRSASKSSSMNMPAISRKNAWSFWTWVMMSI